jgi:SAM-dependent methyltransferase
MDETIVQKLLQLNAEFYQTFASQFSDTRKRIQPGVRKLLARIDPSAQILDLGCGNGELARELAERGFAGQYFGLDFSSELLEVARKGTSNNPHFSFAQANLADPDWPASINREQPEFDLILSFATLHHLPGYDTRLSILSGVHRLLRANGRFILSNWQFLNSERMIKRIHPWEEIGLYDSDVDPDDYLLDWRRGGFGYRYVHHFSPDELNAIATESGFRILETYYSDGESGDLGIYQVWEKSIQLT